MLSASTANKKPELFNVSIEHERIKQKRSNENVIRTLISHPFYKEGPIRSPDTLVPVDFATFYDYETIFEVPSNQKKLIF